MALKAPPTERHENFSPTDVPKSLRVTFYSSKTVNDPIDGTEPETTIKGLGL